MQRGLALPREQIIETFWPECEPERGRSNLNTALWSIRRALRDAGGDPDAAIDANKLRITWVADADIDVSRFHAIAASNDPSRERDAIALYRGEFLSGDFSDWSVAERERVEFAYDRLLGDAVERFGDLDCARRLIERGSYREAPYLIVAESELAAGRASSAASVLARARELLAEIGAEPSDALEKRLAHVRSSAARPALHPELPFCGRAAEYARLVSLFEGVAEGRGGCIVVQGAPGSGKSTLFTHALDAIYDVGVRVLRLTCLPDDARTFGPWVELYERTGGSFTELVTHGADAALLADRLRERLASSVLFVDDAQYLSGDGAEVLRALAYGIARADDQLLLAIATRPEGARELLRGLPRHQSIHLHDLLESDIREALAQIAPRGVDDVAQQLRARSGGHAFFTARLLEAYIADGTVKIENGAWTVAEASQATPPSITGFVAERLFARGEAPAIVACALALEHDAGADDLVEVCGLGEERTLDAIDDLMALDLIEEPTSGPEFRFRHDLIREVAGRALNSGRRVRLHRAFAARYRNDQRLEAQVRCARHLRASGQVHAAAAAFEQAARSVLAVNAWRDALQYARDGLRLAKELRPSKALHALLDDLNAVAARALEEGGRLDEGLDHSSESIVHARATEDRGLVALALTRRAIARIDSAHIREALLDCNEALTVARSAGSSRAESRALRALSTCRLLLGDEACIEDARRSYDIALANELGSADISNASGQVVIASATRHRFTEALQFASHMLEHARRADGRIEINARITGAQLWYLMDRRDDARRELELAADILDQSATLPASASVYFAPLPFMHFRHRITAANLALADGRWDDALAFAHEILAGAFGRIAQRAHKANLVIADACLRRNAPGDHERARAALDATSPSDLYGLIGMSLFDAALRAWTAVRERQGSAEELLHAAATEAESVARRAPLDFDRTFDALAKAAGEIGLAEFSDALRERSRDLEEARRAQARCAIERRSRTAN